MVIWLTTLIPILVIIFILQRFGVNPLKSIVIILLALFLLQNLVLYPTYIRPKSPQNNHKGYRHPSEHGLQTKDLEIITEDHTILRGWLVHRSETDRIIVYFQGNAGSKKYIDTDLGWLTYFIKYLHILTNSDVVAVAYRGYSDSEGTPSQKGLQLDAKAILSFALRYQEQQLQKGRRKEIYVYGRSLGGAVAIYVADQLPFKFKIRALILQNTFTSINDMIRTMFPYFPFMPLFNWNRWPSKQTIPWLGIPILFIRSLKDSFIPLWQMQTLMKEAKSCPLKVEYKVENGTHREVWSVEPMKYFKRLREFFFLVESRSNYD